MSEDFRQERRWKIATAYLLAKWVKEWHEAVDKAALCYDPPSPRYLEDDDERIPKERQSHISDSIPNETADEIPTGMLETGGIDASLVSQKADPIVAENSFDRIEDGDVSMVPENIGESSVAKIPLNPFKILPTIQEKTIDPQSLSLPININLDSNCYTVESSSNMKQGLNHLATYGPPTVKEGDQYLEDDSIVPISKFMLADFIAPPRPTWGQDGIRQDFPIQKHPVKRLPSNQTYTPLPSKNRKFKFLM
jgi:HSA